MAEIVLKPDPQGFPPGTAVKIFERKRPSSPLISGTPAGSQLSEPVVASNGTLTVTGLTAENLSGSQTVGCYVGYATTGGVDRYLFFEVEPAAAGAGSGLTQAQIETLLGTTGISHLLLEGGGVELLKLRSTSTTAHAASIVQAGVTGTTASALNVASSNPESSALQVTGVETGRGSIKVSHTNSSASATGDENAAALSIERHGNAAEKKTAGQGIFMTDNETDTAGASTGPWLTIRYRLKELLIQITSAGALVFGKQEGAITSPAVGNIVLANEGGHLFCVNNGGEKAQLDVLPTSAWKGLESLAKVTNNVAGAYVAEVRTEDRASSARLRGALVQTAEWKAGERLFTLPVAARPTARVNVAALAFTETEAEAVQVDLKVLANGEVQFTGAASLGLLAGRRLYLDNLTWSLS